MGYSKPMRVFAEVCLCFMIFSLAGSIMLAIDPARADKFATDTLFNFFGDFPAFKYWLSVIDNQSFSFPTIIKSLPGMIFAALVNSVLLSFCVKVCKEIFRTFAKNSVALPTLLGVIIGCGIMSLLPKLFSGNQELISTIVTIAIILVGILIMTRTSLPAFNSSGILLTLLSFLPDAFAASAIMEYIAAVFLTLSQRLSPPFPWIFGSALVTIVVLILVYLLQEKIERLFKAAGRKD